MSEFKHHMYVFEAIRPELLTDPDAWAEADLRIAGEHFAYFEACNRREGIKCQSHSQQS